MPEPSWTHLNPTAQSSRLQTFGPKSCIPQINVKLVCSFGRGKFWCVETCSATWVILSPFLFKLTLFFPKASPMLGFSFFSCTCGDGAIRKWREGGRKGNRGK
jgi:hypothetical protein